MKNFEINFIIYYYKSDFKKKIAKILYIVNYLKYLLTKIISFLNKFWVFNLNLLKLYFLKLYLNQNTYISLIL
jgi:hypothetical protein